jgi:RHS repeat-associated protein
VRFTAVTSNAATIRRKTYALGGQPVATRVSGDPVSGKNGIFYMHSDHLGSNSVMSYGQGHASNLVGTAVPNSRGRYFPYGGWRVTPTAGLTDQGYTGHKHNNLGSTADDLGLIFMQARYYLPSAGRFISADTIVPDPTNPQQFNRYTYVLNNPLRFTDPTGHCAQDDAECWQYLENEFCQIVDCNGGDWQNWLFVSWWTYGVNGERFYYFSSPWTKGELNVLSAAIRAVQLSLKEEGINWMDTTLSEFLFQKGGYNMTLGRSIILLTINEHTIWHEMGHAIDAGFGRELHDIFDEASGNCGVLVCSRYASDGYYYRHYGRTGFNPQLGRFGSAAYGLFARQGETWADAFAAWVYNYSTGSNPPTAWVYSGLPASPEWANIYGAVNQALTTKFK